MNEPLVKGGRFEDAGGSGRRRRRRRRGRAGGQGDAAGRLSALPQCARVG